MPDTASSSASEAIGCLLAAGFWSLMSLPRRRARPTALPSPGAWKRVAGTLLVLSSPIVGQAVAGGHLSSNNATLALLLTPVVVAVALQVAGGEHSGDLAGLLWPGLAGLAGMLLLLPEPSLAGWRPLVGLFLLPLGEGAGVILLEATGAAGAGQAVERPVVLSAGCLSGALVIASMFWVSPPPAVGWRQALPAAGLDGASIVLTLVSLGRLGAARWSSQFLLVPLVALVESLFLLRPVLDGRSWVGLALLLVSAFRQLATAPTSSAGTTKLGVARP